MTQEKATAALDEITNGIEYIRNNDAYTSATEALVVLRSEIVQLRAELLTQAQLHHSCGPHAPNFVPFAECKRDSCVRVRALLGKER